MLFQCRRPLKRGKPASPFLTRPKNPLKASSSRLRVPRWIATAAPAMPGMSWRQMVRFLHCSKQVMVDPVLL